MYNNKACIWRMERFHSFFCDFTFQICKDSALLSVLMNVCAKSNQQGNTVSKIVSTLQDDLLRHIKERRSVVDSFSDNEFKESRISTLSRPLKKMRFRYKIINKVTPLTRGWVDGCTKIYERKTPNCGYQTHFCCLQKFLAIVVLNIVPT